MRIICQKIFTLKIQNVALSVISYANEKHTFFISIVVAVSREEFGNFRVDGFRGNWLKDLGTPRFFSKLAAMAVVNVLPNLVLLSLVSKQHLFFSPMLT